jgi:hypothetical protein
VCVCWCVSEWLPWPAQVSEHVLGWGLVYTLHDYGCLLLSSCNTCLVACCGCWRVCLGLCCCRIMPGCAVCCCGFNSRQERHERVIIIIIIMFVIIIVMPGCCSGMLAADYIHLLVACCSSCICEVLCPCACGVMHVVPTSTSVSTLPAAATNL